MIAAKLNILLSSLMMMSCAVITVNCAPNTVGHIDPDLRPQYDKFMLEGHLRNKELDVDELSIEFGTLGGDTVGECSSGGDHRRIIIDRTYWGRVGPPSKEELIFHELGHCVLDRDHCNVTDAQRNPISIMNEYTLDPRYYAAYSDKLTDELFNPDVRCPTQTQSDPIPNNVEF